MRAEANDHKQGRLYHIFDLLFALKYTARCQPQTSVVSPDQATKQLLIGKKALEEIEIT